MNNNTIDVNEEKKKLVLERFKTLNPESKIILGGSNEITIKDLINHVQEEDEFGKRIIAIQIKMLQAFGQ